jgi:hypothetical protein
MLPIACSWCSTRRASLALLAAYHAGAPWPLLFVSAAVLGDRVRPLDTLHLYLIAVAILTAPYVIASRRHPRFAWELPAAMLISAALPTGIANPLTAAGVLFPGLSYFGLATVLLAFGFLPIHPRPTVVAVAALAVMANLTAPRLQPPSDWQGINTRLGRPSAAPNALWTSAEFLQAAALSSSARVVVCPESAVYRWNVASEIFWRPTVDQMRASGRTLIVGAGRSLPGSDRYLNVLEVRGSIASEFVQHVPKPYGMWRPFDASGVPLRLGEPYSVNVAGQRIAPLICYEQLLVWPVLRAMADRPSLILAVSNLYWAHGLPVDRIEIAAVSAWSRLFSVPYISAVNQ